MSTVICIFHLFLCSLLGGDHACLKTNLHLYIYCTPEQGALYFRFSFALEKTGPLPQYGSVTATVTRFIYRVFLEHSHITENISILWNWTKLCTLDFPTFFYNISTLWTRSNFTSVTHEMGHILHIWLSSVSSHPKTTGRQVYMDRHLDCKSGQKANNLSRLSTDHICKVHLVKYLYYIWNSLFFLFSPVLPKV